MVVAESVGDKFNSILHTSVLQIKVFQGHYIKKTGYLTFFSIFLIQVIVISIGDYTITQVDSLQMKIDDFFRLVTSKIKALLPNIGNINIISQFLIQICLILFQFTMTLIFSHTT